MNLAQEPDRTIGGVRLSPSRGTIGDQASEHRVAPQVMLALLVLLRSEGRTLTRDQLIDACWEGRVVSDDAVNRLIASVRSLARKFDPPPFQLHTIPKVGFRLDAAPGGSADAPVAQATAVQLAEATAVASAGSVAGPRRWSLALVALASLGVVFALVLGGAAWRSVRLSSGAHALARVEVATFQPPRNDGDDLNRAPQATRDALIRILRGVDIPVVEPAAAGAEATPGGDYHVRGAVDRDGDVAVINVQVLDRSQRNVLWSGRLERPIASLARFPDQAANRIGDILHCALRSRATSNRPMPDSVLAIALRACELRRVGTADEATQFLAAAERLRAAAPDLSAAQSMYALAAAAGSALSPDAPQASALAAAARAAARRALQLDPKNAEGYFATGISYGFDRAWAERETNFLRAEAMSSGVTVTRDLHVGLLREVGRLREAREFNRRTVADDPFTPDQLTTLVIMTAAADGLEATEPLLQKLSLLAPPEQVAQLRLTLTFWWGEPRQAQELLAHAHRSGRTDSQSCLRDYLAALERPGPHRGLPDACRMMQPDWRMRLLAREGDIDGAYAETPAEVRGMPLLIAFYYPEMRAFRADPRFMPLAARYGLVDYWIRSGRWPDFCGERGRPYDCATAARASLALRP